MQYELCKARLEKISDGCMEFIHPQLIECLLCQQSFNLHQPFNMCRAIRHLKAKHPNLMPEYAGMSNRDDGSGYVEETEEGDLEGYAGEAMSFLNPNMLNMLNNPPPMQQQIKVPRLDHTAAALPPDLDVETHPTAVSDGQQVFILYSEQQDMIQQVIAAGGKISVTTD